MDGVASVHCTDTPLRDALMRLIPPALGQMHLSPDGSGQLIAVHIAAVPLLVQVSFIELLGVLGAPRRSRLISVLDKSVIRPECQSSCGNGIPLSGVLTPENNVTVSERLSAKIWKQAKRTEMPPYPPHPPLRRWSESQSGALFECSLESSFLPTTS